jgi:hypothetical protein
MPTKVELEQVSVSGRTPIAEQAYTPCSVANGHIVTDGCDGFEVEVINDDSTDSVTVVATRVACPLCLATADPTIYETLAPPAAPSIALEEATDGLVTPGSRSVKVTFLTADGESLPSAKSNVVTADSSHEKILTTLDISTDARVTARGVYMSEAGDAGPWKLVDTVDDNTTVSFEINVADGSLTDAAPTTDDALPVLQGTLTVAAGERGRFGPFPASLYGSGTSGNDLYLSVSGDGADNSSLLAVPCLPYVATPAAVDLTREVDTETAVASVTPPARAGDEDEAPTALAASMVMVGGCDDFYFQVRNTDGANPLTVAAERVACPVCGYGTDPSGQGSITVAHGDTGYLGPLPASLYGQGATGTDVYLTSTTTTGTIVALPA